MNEFVNHFRISDQNELFGYREGKFRKLSSSIAEPYTAPVADENGLIPIKVISGDFGGAFSNFTPPPASQGTILIAVDTNSTTPGTRIYAFNGTEWKYVELS